jgi:hypothetical protein
MAQELFFSTAKVDGAGTTTAAPYTFPDDRPVYAAHWQAVGGDVEVSFTATGEKWLIKENLVCFPLEGRNLQGETIYVFAASGDKLVLLFSVGRKLGT